MAKTIFGIDAKEFEKFGRGKEGVVYRGPDNMLLKVYANPERCISEYRLLKKLENSPYFPKVYNCKGIYMLREYVEGVALIDYIEKNGLSKTLANNLIDLSELFYNSKYLRVDGIDKHVFVCKDENLMVIDPRRKKYRFHSSLLKILKNINQEETFLTQLIKNRPDLLSQWYEKENIDLDKYKKEIDHKVDKGMEKKLDEGLQEKTREETKEEEIQIQNKGFTSILKKLSNKFANKD